MTKPKMPGAIPDSPTDEPAKESFEVWWPKYLAKVDESVGKAEEYLQIPSGAISSIQHDPDYIATVKTYAVIEPILNDLIAARPPTMTLAALGKHPKESFQAFVAGLNIGGRVGKVALAKSLGLLTDDQVRFIEGVATLRNRYAHNVKNMHRSLVDILTEAQRGNANIVKEVTGVAIKLPSPDIERLFKMFMYHRLADYLSNALHTLRPPPLPMGSLFGWLNNLDKPKEAPDPNQPAS
jgi:hypothetical protein